MRGSLMQRLWQAGLSTRIIVGLAAGILTGLFFGEATAVLQPLADVYIRLMQMTVLPYLVLTLITGLGRMNQAEAKRLAWRGTLLLVVFWLLALAVVGLMPFAFPAMQNAAFFSSSLVENHAPLALHELYVPSNPFHALANAVIPGVVLFSTAIGAALIGVENKALLLDNLLVMERAVIRVTRFVISLTPIGVFAITAVTAGSVGPEMLVRLEVYFFTFGVAALLLTFVLLPLAVTAVTPFTYREVVSLARDALLTAFVASSAFIVLPMLIERANALLEKHRLRSPDAVSSVEVLVPLAFTFPNAGKLLTLLFVPYAAWLSGNPLSVGDYGSLFGAGLFAYFAKAQVALPFLLDLVGVPQDHFQLYIPTTILTGKFDSMASAMALFAFALVGTAAMTGFLCLSARRILLAALAAVVVVGATVAATRALLVATIDTSYHKAEVLKRMHAARQATPAIVHRDRATLAPDREGGGAATLERIRVRGALRIGYVPDAVPGGFFFNADGELVGFDVELARAMAEALGVTPEFVPVMWREVPSLLAQGVIDVMPGVWYRPYWFGELRLSQPYLTGTMALVVRDARRDEFASTARLHASAGLRIGVPLDAELVRTSIERYFGQARAEFVPLATAAQCFEPRVPALDGCLLPAERGSVATLLHPELTVVVPQPDPVKVPIAFGVAREAVALADVIDEWILFAQADGTIQRAHAYWILGKGAEQKRRRWSILQDMLER